MTKVITVPAQVSAVDRTKYIGGSDAAAVMGLSPWATPVELWREKTGQEKREEPSAVKQRIYDRGHKLEPFIRDMVIDKLRDQGLQVELVSSNQRYTDLAYPFLSVEVDFELLLTGSVEIGGEVFDLKAEHINCDAKSVSGFARKKWGIENTEDVPIEYAAQFMHGLGITGRKKCLVAALRSFDDVDIYWTLRDDQTITAMREKCVQFWQCVTTGTPPDPIDFSDIKNLFPMDNGKTIEATEEISNKVAELQSVKASIKDLEEREVLLTFDVGNFISPNSALSFAGKEICTWKAQITNRIDTTALKESEPVIAAKFTKSTTTRVLRIKKGN